MAVYADRVKETSTTTGTGTYSLAGAATGFRTFIAGVTTGALVNYCAEDGTNWEVGEGTITAGSPDTLTRTTIIASSNAGGSVVWTAGTRNVFLTASAARLVTKNSAGAIALSASDVTNALTYTPYSATNPDGYITGITVTDVNVVSTYNLLLSSVTGSVTDITSTANKLTFDGFYLTVGDDDAGAAIRAKDSITTGGSLSVSSGNSTVTGGRGGDTQLNGGNAFGVGSQGGNVTINSGSGVTSGDITLNSRGAFQVMTGTSNNVLACLANGSWLLGTTYDAGTAGQKLTSGGASAQPTWTSTTSSEVTTALGYTPVKYENTSTAPAIPLVGEIWIDPNSGIEYVWYDDGDSAQWVQFAGSSIPNVLSITTLNTTDGVYVGDSLIIPKASLHGIKVDTLTPTWGWRDLLGPINVRGSGAADPNWNVFRTNISAYQFSVNDECWIDFHIPHDYVPGSDLYIHTHWAVTTASTANVTWGFDITYAKGHNQEAFPATINTTVVQAGSGTAYQHMIAETIITGGALLNAALIEVDGLILMRVYLSANATGTAPFLFMADIHYQSTNIATKNKAPNFYA